MATTADFGGSRLDGTVTGSTGSVYHIATDSKGILSCSCLSWLQDAEMKKGEKRAISARWCKHLKGLKSGTLKLQARPGQTIVERTVIKEVRVGGPDRVALVRAELEAAEAAVQAARKTGGPALVRALDTFRDVRERALATNDQLAEQAEEIKGRLTRLTGAVEETL
jgi:hypothetical protein